MLQKPRWINTRLEYDRHGNLNICEGFWDYGPFLEATAASKDAADWAFHNDGTESGATFIDSSNLSPAKGTIANDTIFFFRQGAEETAGGGWMNVNLQLQYNHEGAGYVDVTATSNVIQSVATANIADNANTTQRITSYTFESTNGAFDEVDGDAGNGSQDFTNNGTEFLYSIQIIGADVSDDDEVELRITIGGTPLDFYPGSAHITVEKAGADTSGDIPSGGFGGPQRYREISRVVGY